MGPVPPPPTPAAIVMTLADAARLAQRSGGERPVTLGDVIDTIGKVIQTRRENAALQSYRRTPFLMGPKVRGKRDASLRSRANRRKG